MVDCAPCHALMPIKFQKTVRIAFDKVLFVLSSFSARCNSVLMMLREINRDRINPSYPVRKQTYKYQN